ncbi:MAG: leucine-rich repeat domain-containing protein [Bacteroidaceae bacterium]|nr:leucine-rich repeat domain-containing protein [Bacteroidaceae bacterium]
MKKIKSILALVFLGAVLATVPVKSSATVVEVVSNSSSGIANAKLTVTYDDGTILGFCRSGSYVYFCGAITSSTSLQIADSISINGSVYIVNRCGYSDNVLDFDEALNLSILSLPPTITYIYNIPSQITDLYLKSANPPTLYSSSSISYSTTIWVPQSVITAYTNKVASADSYWYQKHVHYEGWEPKSVTVTVNSPGSFAQVLLSQVEQWSDVDELTVIGKLNETDLGYLSRLKNVSKIDLSQTDIKTITGCAGLIYLKDILLPSTVLKVQSGAFSGCVAMREIIIPNATSIGSYAFSSCSSLTSVSLPAATSIYEYAFSSCVSLTSVSLPAATSIGSYAFDDCGSLTSVSLPAVTIIGGAAFSDCGSLRSVALPTTLQNIGGDAFKNCSKLEDVYCHVISPLNTTAFKSTGASTTLHVPAFSVGAYMLHDDWYTFNKIVALEGNLDKVNIISDFTLTELKGLADKVDLSVLSGKYYYDYCYEGHLTVSANEVWNVGNYLQSQANRYSSDYDYDSNGCNSTLIPYNEMTASDVTVKYYAETNRWNFISFPFDVNVSEIQYPEGTLWVIRKYSGEERAKMTGNTWQNITNGMTLKAGEGYILHCTSENNDSYSSSYVEFTFKAVDNSNKNKIFAYNDVVTSLSTYVSDLAHNRSWNLVGNPYPCFYDTRNIEHNGVITIWNGNGYTAYSLLDDNYVLRPHEAFFVQCPTDATSMKFKAEGRQHTYDASSDLARVKVAKFTSPNSRQVFNLTLAGTEYTDKARVVINEAAKLDYEISCDASKFMSSNALVPQIYIIENGQKMAIDERPLSDGTISIGMYIGESGDYTIGMSTAIAEDIVLKDNATGKTTNLNNETYTFTASKGTIDNRFSIQIGNTTGIEDIYVKDKTTESAIFSIDGQKLSAPKKGINIINGNKTLIK